jgi:hypothetical protein
MLSPLAGRRCEALQGPSVKHERAPARFVATSVGFVAAVLRPSLLPARLPTKPRHVFQPRPYFDWNSFSSATSSRNGLSSSAMGSGPSATRASRRAVPTGNSTADVITRIG